MKLLTEEIKDYLEAEPLARERANKDKAIVNVLLRRNPMLKKCIDMDLISRNMLVSLVQDHNSMDRAWRKILQDSPHLRGKDYENKEELERDAQAQLGYNVPPSSP